MTDNLPPYRPLVGNEIDQAGVVERELRETFDRLEAEGFAHHVVVASVAAMVAGVIAERTNIATAAAWFYGSAKQCAAIAAAEIEAETKH